jgi:hypothetical protein
MWTAMSCASALVAALELDEHRIDAAATLDVEVAVEDVARGGLHPHDITELDALLERDLQVIELLCALGDRPRTLRRDELHQRIRLALELVARSDEVRLGLELDDRADVALDQQGDEALVALAVVALRARGETLLTSHCFEASMSPSFASSAFFASIMPAPVDWRSAWTSFAVNATAQAPVSAFGVAAVSFMLISSAFFVTRLSPPLPGSTSTTSASDTPDAG